MRSSSLNSSISIYFSLEADSMNEAAFLSIAIVGTLPLPSVPPIIKNLLISLETATRFLILFYERGMGLGAYFSGLK